MGNRAHANLKATLVIR